MLTAYIVVGGVIAILGIIVSAIGMLTGIADGDKQDFRAGAMVFSGTILLAPLWPAWLIIALVILFGYGVFTTARAVRHKTLNFEDSNV